MKQEMQGLPAFEGSVYFYHGAYDEGDGRVTHGFVGVSESEAHAYLARLLAAGFATYTENRIGSAEFHTLTRGEEQVRLAYFPGLCLLKLYCSKGLPLPSTVAPSYQKLVPASITQLGRRGASQLAPGMSFVIQAEDGSFIVVDGGGHDTEDAADLLRFLKEHHPGERRPVVASWMISHPHPDHTLLAEYFLETYGNEIDLRSLAYNVPDLTTAVVPKEDPKYMAAHMERLRRAASACAPESELLVFHTGDVLYFPGIRMDILFTHEDFYPHEFSYVNHLSSAWRITGATRSALLLGDCESRLCQQMAEAYGDALHAGILQTSHHGFNGACLSLYRRIDPEICFWAVDEERFLGDPRVLGATRGYEFNAYLRNPSIRAREHYHSSKEATVLL